ncbi:sterile alpha motif domain-containing protein 9-like [Alosa pseudoharengus]|uniref:sterile alpha motif domain-containing protein 9-like n=1 Tax=Alosa pseudoharengus TaxID=34774 RepID=UPI003F8AB945
MASITLELASLDVIHSDRFEGTDFDQEEIHDIQANFYKGAPPQWVNFYLAEKNGMPFVQRESYEKIQSLVKTYQKRKTVTMVNLLHHAGSGGSTLAMQVLWDLQRKFWCTKLATDVVFDTNVTVKDVIKLVTMQNNKQNKRKPVLLLLDNVDMLKENVSKTLQKRLIDALNEIHNNLPIIILNCARKVEFTDRDLYNTVLLNAELTTEENKKFDQHHRSVRVKYESEHDMFHGFNIIHGLSAGDIAKVCNVIVPPKKKRRPRKDQLFAIIALVNTYAPGSDFLLDQCKKFLQISHSILRQQSFEEQMGHFSDLLITYTNFEKNSKYVRVAHPKIGKKCVQLFRDHGLSMGEVTRLFLQHFCAEIASPCLLQTTKTMLIMREVRGKNKEKHTFSQLIQDIKDEEEKQGKRERGEMCKTLLMEASKIFKDRPTFPQALARCYYLLVDKKKPIKKRDYINAEKWAKEAIKRHPNNSFIMDTLGQVHKHHLIHYLNGQYCQSEVLRLGLLAIVAFQEEEEAAEVEEGDGNVNEANVNISPTFNMRGKLGYLQVAEKLFESLQKIDNDWCDVLRCSRMKESLRIKLKDKYRNLTMNLRAEVERRFEFFEEYLTYSKPDSVRDDPTYIREYADNCYTKYVGAPPKVLKMKSEDKEEMDMLEREEDTITTLTDLQKFLRRHKADHSPELYHLELLQLAEGQDLMDVVTKMRKAYENVYKIYFRSRYLAPLYMKCTEGWQTLSELQLQPWEIEKGASNNSNETEERTCPDPRNIEKRLVNLMRVQGRIEKPNIKADFENTTILVEPHNKEKVLKDGAISFYLGFNIKGPVAFNIREHLH